MCLKIPAALALSVVTAAVNPTPLEPLPEVLIARGAWRTITVPLRVSPNIPLLIDIYIELYRGFFYTGAAEYQYTTYMKQLSLSHRVEHAA